MLFPLASAVVVVQVMQTYILTLPHSYLRIRLFSLMGRSVGRPETVQYWTLLTFKRDDVPIPVDFGAFSSHA